MKKLLDQHTQDNTLDIIDEIRENPNNNLRGDVKPLHSTKGNTMFKKLFIAFSLLAMCVLPFSDTGHSELVVTFSDNTPFKFKVCVPAYKDDSDLEKRLRSFIKRELRALGNVDIVSLDQDWHFLLTYSAAEVKRKDGTKTGYISIGDSLSRAVPKHHFKNYDYPDHLKPVHPPVTTSAYWAADNLLEFAIDVAANFEEYSERFRE